MRTFIAVFFLSFLFSFNVLFGQSDMKSFLHQDLLDEKVAFHQDNLFTGQSDRSIKKSSMEDYNNPPGWIWVKQLGGSGSDVGQAITSDAMGNIYVAGYFSGTMVIDNDTLNSNGMTDMLIMKLSQTGYPLWYKHIPAETTERIFPESIHLDHNGDIMITGSFEQPEINIGGTVLTRVGKQDIFLAKYSNSGNFIWVRSYGEIERSLIVPKVRSDASNNYYMICYDIYQTGYYSVMVKYNSSGQLIDNYQQNDCWYVDIEIDGSGLYLTGTVDYSCDFGDTILEPETQAIVLQKFDLNYNSQWVISGNHLINSYQERSFGLDIAVQSDGNINLLGNASYSLIWDEDTTEFPGKEILFLTEISPDGQVNWTKMTDNSMIYDGYYEKILLDDQNNIHITGYISDTLIYDGTEIIPGYFLLKCDQDGNALWSKNLDVSPYDIQIYGSDKYLLSGVKDGDLLVSRYNSSLVEEFSFQTEGNSGSGEIIGLETDSVANLYTYGNITGDVEFAGFTKQKTDGSFLSRQNSRGNLLWIEYIKGGRGVYGDIGCAFRYHEALNALFIIGLINDTLEIGSETLFAGNGDLFLAKFNSEGTFQWVRQISGYYSDANLSVDHLGNVIFSMASQTDVSIGDSTFTASGTQDIYLAKYDIDGNFKWAAALAGSNTDYAGITSCDDDNMIYFAGELLPGDINFNGTLINTESNSEGDIIFAKMDPDGNPLWIRTFANGVDEIGRYYCWPTSIETDPDGYSYLYGWHGDSIYFDDILLTTGYKDGYYPYSYFITKIDPSGNAVWAHSIRKRTYDFNYNELDMDEAGNVYVMANFRDTLKFEDDYTLVNMGERDMFIAKYYSNGNLAWVKSIETTKGSGNWIEGLAVYDSLSLYAGGYFNNKIYFDQKDLTTTGKNGFVALLSSGKLNCDDFSIAVSTISDVTCHGGQDGAAYVTVMNGLEPISYSWDNDGNSDTSNVFNLTADRYFHVTVTDAMGCVATDSILMEQPDPIGISKSYSKLVCPGTNTGYIDISVSGGTEPYTYNWSNDAASEDLTDLPAGKYYVDITDTKGCFVTDTTVLDSISTYEGSELCLVTVNNQNKIIIVWEKTYNEGIMAYRLYREKSKDNYISIQDIPFDSLSVYVDEASTPEEFSHYYKITAIDSCGNESGFSPHHKSIHLWSSVGITGEVTLNWEEYEGFNYSEYRIFRGKTLYDLYEIRTISSNSKSWTDPDPPSGQVFYRVEVVKDEPCFPTKYKALEYGSTVSNYDEETIETIIPYHDPSLTIYPNPFSDRTRIEFPNPGNLSYRMIITDLAGKVVRASGQITGSEIVLERRGLQPGIYIMELQGNKIYRGKLLIE
jgi:hypothetical protein